MRGKGRQRARDGCCTLSIRIFFVLIAMLSVCKLCAGFAKLHRPALLHGTTRTMATSMPTDGCPLPFEVGPYAAAEVAVPPSSTLADGSNDDEEFLKKLDRSIGFWKENDYTSAWVTIPTCRARLIEHLSNNNYGFDLHHTNSTLQTIIMKKWLRDGTEDKIPPWATHQVGCAGFVLNDKNEILLVKEWSGPLSSRVPSQQWKLPGGLLDRDESFEEATCREVFEETGVPCEFESILSFWHRHGLKFNKSDLYYVCLLRPRSSALNICPVEISAATWMHVDDFLDTQDHPLITHVLRMNFLLDGSGRVGGSSDRMKPSAEMAAGAVQWPNRDPYPTYSAAIRN